MRRGYQPISLNFPRFTGVVRALVIINFAIFVLQSLLIAGRSSLLGPSFSWFALRPELFAQGAIWQLLTFQFLHASTMHLFFNMLALYMFGSAMEEYWGSARFLMNYLLAGVGAGCAFCILAFFHVMGLSPSAPLVGASGGIFGLIAAFGILFAEQDVMLFPFPITLKAKYLVGIILALAFLSLLRSEDPGTATAHLGGALTGFLLVKYGPRRSPLTSASETYYGFRNRYQRWKRKRMAKKFEVFMREHDRSKYFDEYGNFRAPSDDRKRDEENGKGSGSGWVN
jgi:membrane associated rhomboid family serine protease